jgi:hypothetical protein
MHHTLTFQTRVTRLDNHVHFKKQKIQSCNTLFQPVSNTGMVLQLKAAGNYEPRLAEHQRMVFYFWKFKKASMVATCMVQRNTIVKIIQGLVYLQDNGK